MRQQRGAEDCAEVAEEDQRGEEERQEEEQMQQRNVRVWRGLNISGYKELDSQVQAGGPSVGKQPESFLQ